MNILPVVPSRRTVAATARKFVCGAVLGAVVFLLLYGFSTLDPTYDSWIRCGYVEEDIIQHYATWQFFRNAAWQFPLTWLDNAAAPIGAAAAWGDPLPWAALFFKLLSPLLQQTFQYFGIISLLHYMLQGGFAWLLIDLFDTRAGVCIPGTLLLCCWPVLIERTFRHVALSAQWIVLWMLYLYFIGRRQKRLPWLSWCILFGLVPGIHAYFLPMALGMLCASALEQVIFHRRFWRPAGLVVGCMVIALCSARALGVIMPNSLTGSGGYGTYSMNLNALFNPSSMDLYAESGKLDWSLLLPLLPQNQRQYDGFNYLGLGILLALGGIAVYGLVYLFRFGFLHSLKRLGRSLWRHIGLAVACLIFTVFAVSHIVYWNDTLLFAPLSLSETLQNFLGTFRASGRIFWPVGYLLALCVIVFCARLPQTGRMRKKLSVLVLCCILAVQTLDMGGVLLYKAQHFRSGELISASEFETGKAQQLFASTDNILCMGNMFDYLLSESIIRANPNIQTDLVFFARGNFGETFARHAENYAYILSGQPIDENALYIASEKSVCDEVLACAHEDVVAWQIDRFYFFGVATEDRPAPDYT